MSMLLVLCLTAAHTVLAQSDFSYVSDVVVVADEHEAPNDYTTKYTNQGYTLCSYDLNAGAGGAYVYLLYKTSNSNNPNGGYVADFVIKIGEQYYHSDDPITENGYTYDKVPYDGYETFVNAKGDLNCMTDKHDEYFIHLFYRKTTSSDKTAISTITIDSDGTNAVSSTDLNKGAGGDYIYMHVTTAKLPVPYVELSSDGTTLTFKYGAKPSTGTVYDLNTGTTTPDWLTHASTIATVVFDESFQNARPTTCDKWFNIHSQRITAKLMLL